MFRITLAGNALTARSRASPVIRISANTRTPGMIEAIAMNNAELIKELRIAAHALELDNLARSCRDVLYCFSFGSSGGRTQNRMD